VLTVERLTKKYGNNVAVNGVSFAVEKGDSFGLLGPNGAGKTTTISIIAGTIDADSGLASLDGNPIGSNLSGAKKRIGFVPQEVALFDDLSPRANLKFFGALYGMFGREADVASERVLELVGLTERGNEQVRKFSGGMRRRLNIAVGLLHSPDLIILDEPTVGVDPQSRNAIFDTLLQLREQGITILYTTHYMEEVERLCRHVAIMDRGQIVAQGDLASLKGGLGGPQRVSVELDADINLPASTNIPGAQAWTPSGSTVTLEVKDLGKGLSEILGFFADRGLRVIAVKSAQTTLEEVFLDVTGKQLRDSVSA
jgi:ABC-2 type transport system ATP-binding protein